MLCLKGAILSRITNFGRNGRYRLRHLVSYTPDPLNAEVSFASASSSWLRMLLMMMMVMGMGMTTVTVKQLPLIKYQLCIRCGGGNGNPLQYSCWEIPWTEGAWWAIVHEVTKSQTWLVTKQQQQHIRHNAMYSINTVWTMQTYIKTYNSYQTSICRAFTGFNPPNSSFIWLHLILCQVI